jgi:hypothetical protein
LFTSENKNTYQKSLSRFVVLTFCRRAFVKFFQNGGTIQDGGFLTFNFQKFGKNRRIKNKDQDGVGWIFSEQNFD